ncbi:uncharacterized protein LOC117642170 isoform X3 [Thrips palmi]|uniref:Uncharacterized protein LOC117642170 isoform X3 n=1 Tax=Thrips palmi TaxID=161013 RepID=A0A6P8ZJU8_THRPL|nr:uncharacterized protein LOC117642170 isoform X3 [Thrips palmi]
MDTLVEDVSLVMSALDSHGATGFVNANAVFERLESYNSSKCQGKELVNKVVTSFLIDLGLAPPVSDSPEVQIVDVVEPNGAAGPSSLNGASGSSTSTGADGPSSLPSSSVGALDSNATASSVPSHLKGPAAAGPSKALAIDSSVETWTLSPGLCQAFNEPYSPLVSYPSSPEEGKEEKTASNIVPTSLSNGSSTGAIPKVKQSVPTSSRTSPDLLNNSEAIETLRPNFLKKNSCEDLSASNVSVSSPSKRESDVLEPSESTISAKKLKSSPISPKMKTSPGRSLALNSAQGFLDQTMNVDNVGSIAAPNPERKTALKEPKAAAHVKTLSEMFPEADPQYLWDRAEQIENDDALGALIESMLSNDDYPRVFQSNKSFRNASAAAGSANGLFNGDSEFHEFSKPSTSTATVVKSEPSSSVPVVKSEPSSSAQVAKASSSNLSTEDNRAIASTSKASGFVNKPLTTVSSLSEAKRRMSLENSSASTSAVTETPAPAPPPREPWQDQHEIFLQIFPDADPSYLEEKARSLYDKEEDLKVCVANLLENRDYPSRKDWEWRQEQLALQKRYTEEFSIPNFLEIFPDPFTYFADEKRKCTNPNQASMFLRNKYRKLRVADIASTFSRHGYNLTLTCRSLDNWNGATLKGRRTQVEYDIKKSGGKGVDVPFLQEIAFIENEQKIVEFLEAKKKRREDAFNEAKAKGELLQCQCCYDDEVLLEDVRNCSEGHLFCVSCLQKSSEQRIGDGQTTFPCLEDCSAEFGLQMLQEILKPTIFSRLVQRKQAEEVKAAGIEDLVQCPFCDFCNIPPKDDKVFRCLNPDCMKESCRLCKEESHVPLRCEEVERKSEVEIRTYIENKMTEALVRTCWKCSRKFVKEDGCNKMTCTCGALMCYVCRQPVKDYSHFNGQGGDNFERCPLYSDHHALEVAEVKRMAALAKNEVLSRDPTLTLKHDPTKLLPVYPQRAQTRH